MRTTLNGLQTFKATKKSIFKANWKETSQKQKKNTIADLFIVYKRYKPCFYVGLAQKLHVVTIVCALCCALFRPLFSFLLGFCELLTKQANNVGPASTWSNLLPELVWCFVLKALNKAIKIYNKKAKEKKKCRLWLGLPQRPLEQHKPAVVF